MNSPSKLIFWCFILGGILLPGNLLSQRDSSFFSQAFDTERWYRIYLPSDYGMDGSKRYPVVYYFHGWGGRYKWDSYDVDSDPEYTKNGRTAPPFVKEWLDYSQSHEVIIVTWDGYEPNLHPGRYQREGIKYGGCNPYDYPRAHEEPIVHWGWDFRMYFRDLVAHIDGSYLTLADRDHRAVTGLSMGGLSALYISGQNKDLVGSVSAFCPADNIPLYGPKGHMSAFPVLEMYRSLKGLPVRLTATDGDWLLANDMEMKRIFEGTGFTPFQFHLADFPDHWAGDADQQLDFHMGEFGKKHGRPVEWNHICPAFKSFEQWGYKIIVDRSRPALTVLENISQEHMKIFSRTFIPDGPIVADESLQIITDKIYEPSAPYDLLIYNLTDTTFTTRKTIASFEGSIEFALEGGGHCIGIHPVNSKPVPDLRILDLKNRDYNYFESGRASSLALRLINLGNGDAGRITLKATSNHPRISFVTDQIAIPELGSGHQICLDSAFKFRFNGYEQDHLAGNILIEIKNNGVTVDTQKVIFFAVPESPYVSGEDVVILDGGAARNLRIFDQATNKVVSRNLYGGSGNGNGIPEQGEEVVVYIRLEQGLAPKDKNTYHKAYLIDNSLLPYVEVKRLKYDEKIDQAATTSISSFISFADTMPANYTADLWFRLESLYNDYNVPASRGRTYEYKYDYRRARIPTFDIHK